MPNGAVSDDRGCGPPLRPEIASAWRRAELSGLDPGSHLVEPELADVDRDSRLMVAARPVLDDLAQRLEGSRFSLLLADRGSRIVDRRFGQQSLARALDSVLAVPGNLYCEERTGTNSLATAFEVRRGVAVHGEEHFLEQLKAFSCYGYPIVHPVTSRLEDVLDVTGWARDATPVLEPLVAFAVQAIEHRLLQDSSATHRAMLAAYQDRTGRTRRPVLVFGDGLTLADDVLEDTADRRVVTRYTPLGVVGGIAPWNFPILLAVWKIAPALVAGNCIIIKPSPFTPLCTLKLAELVADIATPGVFNVLSGDDDLGKWMTAHEGIDKIAFTGNTETGKDVMRSAAGTLKRITLELGGNDPAIVLSDVDPAKVAPKGFWAAFQNNAQFCNSAKRIYIPENVYDQVRDALVEYARTIEVGDGAEEGTDLGPIQNAPQYAKVKEYFDDCHAHGNTFALGGEIDESAQGWFVPVIIVDNPPEDSRLVQEEPFGPILPLVKWSDEDDVVARANDTVWGLGATVWGRDLKAVERIGRQIDAGTVWLNEVHQYAPNQAFGGHTQSGIGCENSQHGLAEYTNWQSLCLNRTADVG